MKRQLPYTPKSSAMYKKGLQFVNSKYGVVTSAICGLYLIPFALYALTMNVAAGDTAKIVYSLLTLGLGIVCMAGALGRGRKLRQRNTTSNSK